MAWVQPAVVMECRGRKGAEMHTRLIQLHAERGKEEQQEEPALANSSEGGNGLSEAGGDRADLRGVGWGCVVG
jgi:hypothetical protein